MKKIIRTVVIVLVVLVAVLFLARNFIARESVEIGAKKLTGFPLTIGSVNLGLFASKVDVHDLRLMNPSDFQEPMFVDMPELYVDYQLGSMLKGAPHINDMFINFKQLVIVKNKQGESNAMKLKGVLSSGDSSSKYTIDTLRLKFDGEAVIKDYSRAKPTERHIPLNINATYHNVTEATPITRLALMTVSSQVRLPDIGIKTEDLKKGLEDVTKSADKAAQGIFDSVSKALNPQKQ